MCGIAGFSGCFSEDLLDRMGRALAHRGPDDEGRWLSPPDADGRRVGLRHRRLAVIDLAGGHQPMWSADQSLAIVFNGEIYNYRQLRAELAGEGANFRTASDTEVILEGWVRHGPRILPRLAGMFAFAIWNGRAGEWALARDRSGIKPLYFAEPSPGTLVFASEIKAILPSLPKVELSRRALYEFLLYGWTAGPETIFAGVRSLPPGTWTKWSATAPRISPQGYAPPPRPAFQGSPAAAAAELSVRLDRAVESHLVADVPIGLNLSGGLDSSAVLARMAARRELGSIDTFTVGFGRDDDETEFAALMARHTGVRNHQVRVTPTQVVEDFPAIVRALEEPIAHPVLHTTLAAARLARERVKVVMIGEGADELFLGYPQHQLLRWPFRDFPPLLLQRHYFTIAGLMPPGRELAAMLSPGLLDRGLLAEAERRFDGYFCRSDLVEGIRSFESDYPLVAAQLMRIDKLTMACGLEARVPFLDSELVAWARTLPISNLVRGRWGKEVLRRALAADLPRAILRRPKTGRGGTQRLLPYFQELFTTGPLAELLSRELLGRRGWFDPDRIAAYLGTPGARRGPIESRRRAKFAYALGILELWARQFLDRTPS